MPANILISTSEAALADRFSDYFVAHVDGQKARTLRQFYEQVADVLEFPDASFTLETFNDALNDLTWLDEPKIALYFTHTDALISQERDPGKAAAILTTLEATAEDWKWADDADPADRKELILIFEDSPRIRQLLQKEGIEFEEVSE